MKQPRPLEPLKLMILAKVSDKKKVKFHFSQAIKAYTGRRSKSLRNGKWLEVSDEW
jgi:hypothetical protein